MFIRTRWEVVHNLVEQLQARPRAERSSHQCKTSGRGDQSIAGGLDW